LGNLVAEDAAIFIKALALEESNHHRLVADTFRVTRLAGALFCESTYGKPLSLLSTAADVDAGKDTGLNVYEGSD
jgi:hypothetical protein